MFFTDNKIEAYELSLKEYPNNHKARHDHQIYDRLSGTIASIYMDRNKGSPSIFSKLAKASTFFSSCNRNSRLYPHLRMNCMTIRFRRYWMNPPSLVAPLLVSSLLALSHPGISANNLQRFFLIFNIHRKNTNRRNVQCFIPAQFSASVSDLIVSCAVTTFLMR